MSDLLRAVLGQLNLWFSALLTRLMLGKEMSSWLIISERGWKGMAWAKGHFSLFFFWISFGFCRRKLQSCSSQT